MFTLLHTWEEKCIGALERTLPRLAPHVRRYQRLIRYIIAGGTAASVDFAFLYLFTDLWGIHYLSSSVLAFLVAFVVSFLLQKFWTFQDHSMDGVHAQAVLYFVVAALNLGVNTFLMYAFVDWLQMWYIAAQFLASILIAFESFFVSRYFIFKGNTNYETDTKVRNTPPNPPLFRQRTDPPQAEKRGGGRKI
ncbi:MAG: GtrA family protein [bacterium]|nr:GtrA family protein [bacterium]